MPFPTTSVLDNFTGTDGTDLPVYSSNWSTVGGQTTFEIQSNAAAPSAASQCMNYWDVETFGPDCESYCIVTAKSASGFLGVTLRMQDSGLSTFDCYLLFHRDAAPDQLEIYHFNNGSASQVGADVEQEVTNGDSLGLEAVGTTLTVYYKSGAGAWSALDTRDGSAINAAGHIGLYGTVAGVRLDNFGGGTVVVSGGTAITATVGISNWAGQGASVAQHLHVAAGVGTASFIGRTASLQLSTGILAGVGISIWGGNAATIAGGGVPTEAATITGARVFRAGKSRIIYGG